jgi:hypothetical protein
MENDIIKALSPQISRPTPQQIHQNRQIFKKRRPQIIGPGSDLLTELDEDKWVL